MDGIGVVGGDLGDVVVAAPSGSNGILPAETTLEGLLAKDTILLHPLSMSVYVNNNGKPGEVHLTPTEFKLLEYLMRNAGRAVPYDEISRKVLGYSQLDGSLQDNIRAHVCHLRKKIGQKGIEHIQTIHGFGYRFIRYDKPTDDVYLGNKESIILYQSSRRVYVNDNGELRETHLTRTEFNLLEYLMRNAGKDIPLEEISRKVFRYSQPSERLQKSIIAHVGHLRKKLGDDAYNPIYIATVIGVGYKFIVAHKHDNAPLGSEKPLPLYPHSKEVYIASDGGRREVRLTIRR